MPTIVFIALCASLVVGVMLVWIGRRGRKLNDHPVCRWCGFDVSGTYPASYMCPECGGGLKREHGVRIGVRKRMPTLIILGALLVLLPLAPMGIAFYGVITGANLNKWKPVGVLLWEAGMVGKPASEAIAKELLDRMITKALSKDQEEAIAARAVELQKDAGFAWTYGWSEVCDRVRLDGAMTDEQRQSLKDHCLFGLKLTARAQVQAGGRLPLRVRPVEMRVPANDRWSAPVMYRSIKIDGQAVSMATQADKGSLTSARMGQTQLGLIEAPDTTGRVGEGDMQAGAVVDVPKTLAPGEHTLTIRVQAIIHDMAANSSAIGRVKESDWQTLTTTFRVAPPEAPIVQATTPSAADVERLRAVLADTVIRHYDLSTIRGAPNPYPGPRYSVNLMIPQLPTDIPSAFMLIARMQGREYVLRPLASKPVMGIYSPLYWGTSGSRQLVVNVDGPWAGPIELILRPSLIVAESTLDLSTYCDTEIVAKDIDVIGSDGAKILSFTQDGDASKSRPITDEPTKPAGKP